MGASVSTNQQTIENSIIAEAYNKCPAVGTTQITNLTGIQFDPPANCNPPSSFTVGQTSTIDGNCLLTNLQSSVASTASQLSAQAQAGLGLSGGTNIAAVQQSIAEKTVNDCGQFSTTQQANISDTVIKSCQFQVVQNASQNVSCQINSTQNLASNVAASAAAQAQGGSIFGDLFGTGKAGIIAAIVVGIILLVIVIGLIIFAVKSGGKSGSGGIPPEVLLAGGKINSIFGGSGTDYGSKNGLCTLIIFLIIIALIYYIWYYNQNKNTVVATEKNKNN